MLDSHTRTEYARVTRDAQTLLARLGAKPGADSDDERPVAAPPASSTLKNQGNPRLPLSLALAATAGVAALMIACVSEVAQLVFVLGAVAAALMGALLAVLAYANPTQDVVNVISDLERLVGKLIGIVESQPTVTPRAAHERQEPENR